VLLDTHRTDIGTILQESLASEGQALALYKRCSSLEEANRRLEEFKINAERIERRASSYEPHSM
jgi:hypothetical protein